jgi:hypothetical protein
LARSRRIFPRVAERYGYVFNHTELAGALEPVLAATAQAPVA